MKKFQNVVCVKKSAVHEKISAVCVKIFNVHEKNSAVWRVEYHRLDGNRKKVLKKQGFIRGERLAFAGKMRYNKKDFTVPQETDEFWEKRAKTQKTVF